MVEKQRKESAQSAAPAPIQYFCERQGAVRLGKVCTLENPCESSMKNSFGKPCEGKLHARFDVGGTDSLFKIIIFMDIKYCVGYQALLYCFMLKKYQRE